MRPSLPRRLGALALLAAAAALLVAPAAGAAPRPSAIVSLGDSYISGEAGRWLGNSVNVAGSRDGTDRACVFTLGLCASYDDSQVYVDASAANGCHRADVAAVRSATVAVARRVNLACSGAVTRNLLRASGGGASHRGEPPQADQLLAVARATRTRMVAVSIGGNDFGFAAIVDACVRAYLARTTPCSQTQAAALADARVAEVSARIAQAIDEIRAVMRAAGRRERSYRLVLQTYPLVIPRAASARYAEADPRRGAEGCPFYDVDMDWAHDVAAPRIASAIRAAAAARGAELLELRGAFAGHEICARTAAAVTPLAPPSPTASEWGRAVSPSAIAQGPTQELFHPNAYGHRALGDCLGALFAARRGWYACAGAAGRGPADQVLTPLR